MEREEIVQRILKLREQLGIPILPENVKLFELQPGNPRDSYAVVSGLNTWDALAEGYKRAADLVTDHVLAKGAEQDFLVYPICFLYRCYLELRLKEVLAYEIGNTRVKQYGHDLSHLWEDAQPVVARATFTSQGELQAIMEYVDQFQTLDARGDGWRYPVDRYGTPNLPEVSQFSLGALKNVMAGIAVVLDGASTGLSERASQAHQQI